MANLLSKRIRLEAKKFNKLRAKTTKSADGSTSTGHLLGRDGRGTGFDELYTLTDWMWDYSDFREKAFLMIATELDAYVSEIKKASHFDINGQVYEIGDRDIVAPTFKTPYWRVYGDWIPKSYPAV